MSAVFRTECFKLRLDFVTDKALCIKISKNLVNIKLFCNGIKFFIFKSDTVVNLDNALAQRLTITDMNKLTKLSADFNSLIGNLHLFLKLGLVPICSVLREGSKMNALGCVGEVSCNKSLIYCLRNKRSYGSNNPCECFKNGIKSHICRNLVLGKL